MNDLITSPDPESGFNNFDHCQLIADGPLCFDEGRHVLLPNAQPPNTHFYISFDHVELIDESGLGHQINGTFIPGPSMRDGNSALLKNSYLEIASGTNTEDFAYTFWMYSTRQDLSQPEEQWCPVISKGGVYGENLEMSPSLFLGQQSGRLKLMLSTTSTSRDQAEYLISNSRILNNRWYHITIVRHLKRLRLYVNGVLDSTITTRGATLVNEHPLYVGGTPTLSCPSTLLVDDLRGYTGSIGRDQIQAEASMASIMEPSAFHLACVECTLLQAEEACPGGFHLCTSMELHGGPLGMLQSLGILGPHTRVLTEGVEDPGVGACCVDA